MFDQKLMFDCCLTCRTWLREGWYSFTVEGAIWSPNSQYDNLMSVAGIDKFGSKHADYMTVMPGGNVTDAISLYGGFKGAGWVMPQYNKTRVGVQRRPTWLNYFQGPETSITVSGVLLLPWVRMTALQCSTVPGRHTRCVAAASESPLCHFEQKQQQQQQQLQWPCGFNRL
jgi:hypothetical protein